MLAATALSLVPLWLAPIGPDDPGDQQRAPIAVADLEIASEPGVQVSTDPPPAIAVAVAGLVRAGSLVARSPAIGPQAVRQLAVLTVAPKTSPPRDA